MIKLELELEEAGALQSGLEKLLGDDDILWDEGLLEWQLEHLLSKVRNHLDEVRNPAQKLGHFDEDKE